MGWDKIFRTVASLMIIASAALADTPQTVNVALGRSYVPIGFDNNDRVQVTVVGIFPDTCYKVAGYETRVDAATNTIFIRQSAYHYGGECVQVTVPFTQVVDLGILRDASYTLKDETSGKELGTLPVTQAKGPWADDYLYAPVTEAYVRTANSGKAMLYLKGNFTDRCTKLKDVWINYYNDVIVVQPIAEHIGEARNCGPQLVRYQVEKELKEGLTGTWLLHVRAMDGQAVNRLTEFE